VKIICKVFVFHRNGRCNVNEKTSAFSERLAGAQFDLYAFITILMRGSGDAADVLQETNLAILKHEATYDPSRPFLLWARGVARKCVLKFYSARSHEKLLIFDDAMIDSLAEQVPCAKDDRPVEDLARLSKCMGLLAPKQREIVTARYIQGEAVKAIASRISCSEGSVSVLLHRIRLLLADCVEKERKRIGVTA